MHSNIQEYSNKIQNC